MQRKEEEEEEDGSSLKYIRKVLCTVMLKKQRSDGPVSNKAAFIT